MIRIIAGTKKGKQIKVLDKVTKPLTDRIKTSIFDLIKDFLKESRVMDLFAGSGNFAIEALSRGAKFATMIELNPKAVDIIKENVNETGFSDKTEIVCKNSLSYLKEKNITKFYDIVFLDPPFPFSKEEKQRILELSAKLLDLKNPDALIIFRYPAQETYYVKKLKEVYSKRYGISIVSFYKKGN